MPRLASLPAAALAIAVAACPGKPEGPTKVDAGPCYGIDDSCDSLGATRCNEESGDLDTCQEGDEACPIWTPTPCGAHQLCDDSGEAAECVCDHECEASSCDDNLLESCITDMDGCRFVVEVLCSPTSQVCQTEPEAACACADVCTVGDFGCDDDMVLECVEDSFGCPRWQDTEPLACPEHQGCVATAGVAACGCLDPCALGESSCDGDMLQDCAEDSSGCLYWADAEDCAAARAMCDAEAATPVCDPSAVTLTAVGSPLWEIVELHQISARITAEEDFPNLVAAVTPNHWPWVAHAPPYDHEIADAMAQAGYVDIFSFADYQFSVSTAETYHLTIAPGASAPTGHTPDYADGPLISADKFPLLISGQLYRDEQPYGDPVSYALDLDWASPEVPVTDGVSHLHDHSGALAQQAGDELGDWAWRVEYRDVNEEEGWDLELRFRVR